MHRCLVALIAVFAAALVAAPRASAGDASIGHLGDTLRVDTGKIVADVTVSSVQPVDPPPGFGYHRVGVPVKSFPGSAMVRADGTIHAISVPDPHQMLDAALTNAPAGSTVRGGVYWEAYRDPVSNVVLLDKKTGVHLAQWTL